MAKRPVSRLPKVKKEVIKKKCTVCGRELALSNFYNTNNILSGDGKASLCKVCMKKMIDYDNIQTVYDILQGLNLPFFYDTWSRCKEINPEEPWSPYIRMANSKVNEFKDMAWKDSYFLPLLDTEKVDNKRNLGRDIVGKNKNKSKNKTEIEIETELDSDVFIDSRVYDFQITDEIIDKWGSGYSREEYYYFEKKWNKLIDNYGEKTSLHSEGLIIYIRFRVKEELATSRGELKEAKEWGSLASTASKDAKLNVAQLSKSDISGGVDLLPQLFEAVESEVGIISVLPMLKEQPYDDVDLIIWCNINYIRRLEDKPRIEYRDIWGFYDEMLQEHFEQKGYTEDMVIKEKEKRNNIFRDLGQVYKEPVYEDGDN